VPTATPWACATMWSPNEAAPPEGFTLWDYGGPMGITPQATDYVSGSKAWEWVAGDGDGWSRNMWNMPTPPGVSTPSSLHMSFDIKIVETPGAGGGIQVFQQFSGVSGMSLGMSAGPSAAGTPSAWTLSSDGNGNAFAWYMADNAWQHVDIYADQQDQLYGYGTATPRPGTLPFRLAINGTPIPTPTTFPPLWEVDGLNDPTQLRFYSIAHGPFKYRTDNMLIEVCQCPGGTCPSPTPHVPATIIWTLTPSSTPTNTLTPTATPTPTSTKPVVTVRPVPTATPTTACGYRYCVAVTPTPPNRHGSPTPTFTPTPYISAVYTNTTPVAIPDDSTPVSEVAAYSRITIGDLGQTAQVITVTLSITHTYIGDLAISLYDPNSATALLVSKVGKANGNFTNLKLRSNVTAPQIDDFGTADVYLVPPFEDSAYTFKPSNPFVIGAPVSGTWMLEVLDDVWGDIGTLGSWSIQFDTTQPTPTPMPVASAYLEVTTDRSGRTPVRSAQTAASGCINFSLPADTYYFWAYDSQWLLANPTIKTVPAGRNSCGFQYCVTANGAALANVLVAASTSPTGLNYVQTGLTDAAGCVELVLPAGTYYFFRQKAGYSWIDPDTEQVTP
jgi:subtilisin-like proprotein convertase family protein